jgi:L-threonylcarbamoyladenylate synthase
MVKVFEVKPNAPRVDAITEAASAIRAGGLVVYPTETVYGLGADARSNKAIKKIFKLKGREAKKPIPIAVNSIGMTRQIAELNPVAEVLFTFLPGPLTIVAPARSSVSKLITAGTGKVGIRVPNHPVALKLIDFVGGPITSTSANLSGKPAPLTVREALEQIGKSVDVALDAGKCKLGIPSTVVDATSKRPKVLRRGPISEEEIRKVLSKFRL